MSDNHEDDADRTHVLVSRADLDFVHRVLDANVAAWADDDVLDGLEQSHQAALWLVQRMLGLPDVRCRQPAGRSLGEYVDAGIAWWKPGDELPVPPHDGDGEQDAPVTEVVYGLADRWESLAVVDARRAEQLAAEIGVLRACGTLGELRELVPTLVYAWSPIRPDEDDWPFESDSHPIEVSDSDCWPPMPVQYGLDERSGDVVGALVGEAGAGVVSTILDGDYLYLPPDREDLLLAVLARHAITARRDDLVIAGLE